MFSRRTDWELATSRFAQAIEEARRNGAGLLDLSASNPTKVGLTYDLAFLASLGGSAALAYDPDPKGLLSARQAVADYYREHDVAVNPERIILTTSTSEAYSFIFRLLCNPGDQILVPAPSYPLFQFLADVNDVSLAHYLLIYDHGWHLDLPSLERAIAANTRAILVVHPNNPTGSFVSPEERAALNRFCTRHKLALIADEVFLDYPANRASSESFAANQDVLTFTLSGVSKISCLPQMKFAWLAASGPSRYVEPALKRLEVISDTYLSMNTPIQLAAPHLLAQARAMQQQLKRRIAENLQQLDAQLSRQKECARLEIQGGWYAIIRVPATRSDEDVVLHLLRTQAVVVHPGHFYDFPSPGHLVVSLITPSDEFRTGIARILGEIPQLI